MDGPLTTEAMRLLVRLIVAEPSGGLALSLGSLAACLELVEVVPNGAATPAHNEPVV